jgi:NADH-quinone oxidoreductase subunit E
VEEVECLAACGGAPALQVNYEFHERVTPEQAGELVDGYRTGALHARTVSGGRKA